MNDKFYVNYEVEGFGKFQAGPYSQDEVDGHHRDIRGYDRVINCYVSSDRDESRSLIWGGQ